MRTQVWSSGGGRQSSAIAALIVQGRLPKPDIAVIVDTGRERSSTWEYQDQVIIPALTSVGVKMNRISKTDFATVDLWSTNGDLLLPVFIETGKLPAYCSNEWKRRVMMRWFKFEYGPRQIDNWLGISTNEMARVRVSDVQWLQHRYPLIELGLSAADCIQIVKDMGWPEPVHSSCWTCPNMSGSEWSSLSDSDFKKAVSLDETLREEDPGFFLHRSRRPLSEIKPEEYESDTSGCSSGYCFV